MSETSNETRYCYRHPDRETLLACSDCGRPICGQCSIDAAVGQKCPQCLRSVGRQPVIRGREIVSGRGRIPPVTMTILAVSVALFFGRSMVGIDLAQVSSLVDDGQWWRIFSAALLHADLTHILFNMYALYVLGPQIERHFGAAPYLALYVASAGVGGVFAQYFTAGAFVAVGASGAIFGLFGIWLQMAIRGRNTRTGRNLLSQLGFVLLINAALPLFIRQISWQAHLGGLIAGFLIGEIWSRVKGDNEAAIRTAMAVLVAVLAAAAVII